MGSIWKKEVSKTSALQGPYEGPLRHYPKVMGAEGSVSWGLGGMNFGMLPLIRTVLSRNYSTLLQSLLRAVSIRRNIPTSTPYREGTQELAARRPEFCL